MLKPLGQRIICKDVTSENTKIGDIILPDSVKEQAAEVIAVGPGRVTNCGVRVPVDVKVGDRVMFDKWSRALIRVDGEELVSVSESDVMLVLEPEPEQKPKKAKAKKGGK